MELLKISCRCITYGRVHMLEESIYSFLQQEYEGWRELVIVNDYPFQKLIFDHPRIKIYNLDKTFGTLGEKENFTIEKCSGDIIALFDDDDVALPNHLQNINKYFKENTSLLQWHRGIFYNEPNISSISGLGNAGMVYSKKAWEKSGGYGKENAGHDMTFVMKLRTLYPDDFVSAAPSDDDVSFMYMWSGRGYHASGQGNDTPDRPNIIQRHTAYIEQMRAQGSILTGTIKLNPHWNHPYPQLLKDYVRKNQSVHSK